MELTRAYATTERELNQIRLIALLVLLSGEEVDSKVEITLTSEHMNQFVDKTVNLFVRNDDKDESLTLVVEVVESE